jgi:hypothetical protein
MVVVTTANRRMGMTLVADPSIADGTSEPQKPSSATVDRDLAIGLEGAWFPSWATIKRR